MPPKMKLTDKPRLLTMKVTAQDQAKLQAARDKMGTQSVADTIRALLTWYLGEGKK